MTLGLYDAATKDFIKAVESNKNYVKAYYYRGIANYETGKFDEVMKDCEKAVELYPMCESELRPYITAAKGKLVS